MDIFEKIIKQEDYSKNEILNHYTSFLQYGLKGLSYYAAWAENELEEIKRYLYTELKTGQQRIGYIESYIKNEEGKRHFLNYRIIQYIGEYYNDSDGIPLIKSLENVDAKDIIQFYHEKIIPAHLAHKKRIGTKKFSGHKPIAVYEKVRPTPTMMLADGLYELYQQAENELSPSQQKGRIFIEWTQDRISELEYCTNKYNMFSYTSIEAVKGGEKIRAKNVHDIIGLLTAWNLQEEGTGNKRNKIIEDNFIYKGKPLVSTTIGSYRQRKISYHSKFRESFLKRA